VREPAGPEAEAGEPGGSGAHPAARLLRAAYPSAPEHDRAVRWLTWIAWHQDGRRDLAWWEIPGWVGEPALRHARTASGAVLLGLAFGLGFGGYAPPVGLGTGLLAALISVYLGNRLRPGRLRRGPAPQAMIPARPRTRQEAVLLALAVATGLFLRPVLVRVWGGPVAGPPSASFRACRRSTAIDAAACLLTGLPLALAGLAAGEVGLAALAAVPAGLAVLTALADGPLPGLRQAELALLVRRRRRVSFRRLLETAGDRQVLVPAGPYYQFRDPSVQQYLHGLQQSVADERTQRAAERKRRREAHGKRIAAAAAGKQGVRPWLLGQLPENRRFRLGIDVGAGAALAITGWLMYRAVLGWHSVSGALLGTLGLAIAAAVIAVSAIGLIVLALDRLVWILRWSLWLTSRMSPAAQVAIPAGAVAAAGLLTALTGPAAVRHGIAVPAVAVMPAVTVTVVGGWASVLVHRRWRAAQGGPARHQPTERWPAGRWLARHAADLLLAVTAGVAVLLLIDRNLPGAQAAAGLLFPVAVWLSVVGWRAMNASGRLAVRAAADIAVALLLGSTLVLLLVWLASLLHMPPAEVWVLRGALGRASAAADLPWWLWTALFALLAGVSLAFAVWPGRLKRVTGWFTRLRVVPSVTVTSRVTSGVHIGLLVVVLVGLAAPAAVEPALRARLADRYTETLADDLRAHGELAAYRQTQRAFRTIGLPLLAPLADLVLQIDRTSRPRDGQRGATGVELDLARRMGQLQAVALRLAPPDIAAAEAAVTREAGLDEPAASPDAENERLARLDSARQEDQATERLVDQAAELAASAVARALPLPGLGDTEIAQVIKEYLSSLVEDSPLKDVFAAWAGRIAGRDEPPGAAAAVVPDPARLKDAALAAAGREVARTPVTDPAAVSRLAAETGVAAAVDLANQVRYLQEGNGPCEGCTRPEPPADRRGPDDHPFKPPEFVR
jgi:hypothetical protein